MSFSLRVDGEVVYTVDEQVTGVHVMSARGEVAVMGISTEGVVDIVLDKVAPGSPVRLDQVEAAQQQALRDRAEEGVVVGSPRPDSVVPVEGQLTSQGVHTETLRPGGVDKEAVQTSMITHPTRDLFDGLQPNDTDTRTARIEAFGEHGDVQKAIDECPAGSGSRQTSEEPVVSSDSVSQGSPGPETADTGVEGSPAPLATDTGTEGSPLPSAPEEGGGGESPQPSPSPLNLGGQPQAPGSLGDPAPAGQGTS